MSEEQTKGNSEAAQPVAYNALLDGGRAAVGSQSIADQVKDLERRAADWEKLAREIMATIRVNRLRGTITSADEKHFDQICEGWYRWMMRIVTGREEPLQYGGIYSCQICGEAHKNGDACPHYSESSNVSGEAREENHE